MKDLGYLAQDISILHRQYYKDTTDEFNKLDLNPTEACILLTINDHESVNQNQIARLLVLDKGMIARQISKLANRNLVSKQRGHGKKILISLTAEGKNLLQQVQIIRSNWWKERFEQTGISADSPIIPSIEKVVRSIVSSEGE